MLDGQVYSLTKRNVHFVAYLSFFPESTSEIFFQVLHGIFYNTRSDYNLKDFNPFKLTKSNTTF